MDDLVFFVAIAAVAGVFAHHAYGRRHDRPGIDRGEVRLELLILGLISLLGTLAMVLTDHADSGTFDRLSYALLAAVSGSTIGTLTARSDRNKRS